jgi:translation initiation factor IF-2
MSLEALAEAIQVDPSDIMRTLFMKGIMLSMNQVLDKNTVKLVAGEFDLLVVDKAEAGVTAGAVKQRDFLELEDLDDAVSCYITLLSLSYGQKTSTRRPQV